MQGSLQKYFAAIVMASALIPAGAFAQCHPNSDCNLATGHPLEWCRADGLWGDSLKFFSRRRGDSFDVRGLLQKACELYTESHAYPASGASWEPCTPVVPDDSNSESFGSHVAGFHVSGTWRVRNDKGQVTFEMSGNFNFLTCGCFDPENPDYEASGVGNDGICYCKGNRTWDAPSGKCIASPNIRSVTLDGPSSASAMPGSGVPLVATVRLNGVPVRGTGVHIAFNGQQQFTGETAASGELYFTYMPATTQTTDTVTATCDGCVAPANKTITVGPADFMCTPGNN